MMRPGDEPSISTSSVAFHMEDENMNEESSISQRKKAASGIGTGGLSRSTSAIYELAAGGSSSASAGTTASTALSPKAALLQQAQQSSYSSNSSLSSSNSITVSTSASSNAPRKRRLPQSGLTLCGRRWLLGAEDMCIPACWSAQFDMLLVVISIVAWRYIYTSEFPDTCGKIERSQLEAYVVMHAVGYFALLALDISTMLSALYSSMFVRNRKIVLIIYARLAVTALVIVFTLLANIEYFQVLRPNCAPDAGYDGSLALHRLLTLLFLSSLCSFLVFGSYFLCSYGFGPCCGKGTTQSWGKHLQRWLLCYTPTPTTNGRNVMESIAYIFTMFFASDRAAHECEDIHIVPSDILVGFALVEANQVRRAVEGFEFLIPAPLNRWTKNAFQPHHMERGVTEEQQFQKTYGSATVTRNAMEKLGQNAAIDTDAVGMSNAAGAPSTSGSSSSSQVSPDPLHSAELALRASDRSRDRILNVLPEEKPDRSLTDSASQGLQPTLDPRDWQKIADARHFSKYALGSYGWLLYAFNNLSCFVTCTACRCCKRAGYNHANMIGSGCGYGFCGTHGCCHWSIASFLLTTGVADQDILYAQLSQAPIYYLAIDHHQKCLVICCRGTLSVADAVIDLDAQLSPLDGYGYKGGYTHTGILENALRLREDLDERGHMARFLQQHPDYNITVVGHSLGAATAALLTLLLRERYDQGPPAVTTAGRLTPETRNKLSCIAYGCPLLLDLGIAHSEFALRCMTSIVNHSDIISRLSLATCSLLKDQMISCFSVSSSSKFKILSNSLRKNYAQSFEPGSNMHEVGSPRYQQDYHSSMRPLRARSFEAESKLNSPDEQDGVTGEMILGSVARAMDTFHAIPDTKEDSIQERKRQAEREFASAQQHMEENDIHGPSPQALLAGSLDQPHQSHQLSPPPSNHPSNLPSIPAMVVTGAGRSLNPSGSNSTASGTSASSSSSSLGSPIPGPNEFTMHLRKCYMPGRIYHILPGTRDPTKSRCFGLRRAARGSVIYPAAQETFQEIVVSKTMFSDHLPEKYQLDLVNIPEEFIERTDEESPRPPLSPPIRDEMTQP